MLMRRVKACCHVQCFAAPTRLILRSERRRLLEKKVVQSLRPIKAKMKAAAYN